MIHLLEKTNLVLCDEPLPFTQEQRAPIDAYWKHVTQKNSRLWNGDYYMFSDLRIENRVLFGSAHKTDFATFLYWRDHGRADCISHITGTTFPQFPDGSLLAIKMAAHTANAGRIYFPAGALDRQDMVDSEFDVISNIRREWMEEIGLEIEDDWFSGPLLASESDNSYHVTRLMQLPIGIEELEKIWKAHSANGGDDEIERLAPICNRDVIPLEMPPYATALCHYHFDRLKRQ